MSTCISLLERQGTEILKYGVNLYIPTQTPVENGHDLVQLPGWHTTFMYGLLSWYGDL